MDYTTPRDLPMSTGQHRWQVEWWCVVLLCWGSDGNEGPDRSWHHIITSSIQVPPGHCPGAQSSAEKVA